ncbi:hypothetical protein [Levilactobacillus sp. HBUAS70063]|uniref:hypothetical protein n=1 Tax=Levilactobacillus sp. HBUAS70063 TaxID=3109359 RepID=UPI0031329BB6
MLNSEKIIHIQNGDDTSVVNICGQSLPASLVVESMGWNANTKLTDKNVQSANNYLERYGFLKHKLELIAKVQPIIDQVDEGIAQSMDSEWYDQVIQPKVSVALGQSGILGRNAGSRLQKLQVADKMNKRVAVQNYWLDACSQANRWRTRGLTHYEKFRDPFYRKYYSYSGVYPLSEMFHKALVRENLISINFHGIELSVAVALSGCKKLQHMFDAGKDVYLMLGQRFAKTLKLVGNISTSEEGLRELARRITYFLLRGNTMLMRTVLMELHQVDDDDAYERLVEVRDDFFTTYPELQNPGSIINNILYTPWGTAPLPRHLDQRTKMRTEIETVSNTLVKEAMISCYEALAGGGEAKLVLPLQNESLWKIADGKKDKFMDKIIKSLEDFFETSIPNLNLDFVKVRNFGIY